MERAEWASARQWRINSSDPELTLRFEDLSNRQRVLRKLRATVELKLEQLAGAMESLQGQAAAQASVRTLLDASWMEAAVDVDCALSRRIPHADSELVSRILRQPGNLLFEGAQGVLLDEWYGFQQYATNE